jgi:K+-sensing histidine kinase KdpD
VDSSAPSVPEAGGDDAVDQTRPVTDPVELDTVARVAAISAGGTDLERLSRPLLELLGELTGFESTYVTVLHWEDFKQEVRYARNVGDLEVPEGIVVEWSDTLCRRALLEGRSSTADVPSVWPDSAAAAELGIVSYVSVPIVTPKRSTFGTLCAASARSIELGEGDRRIMELFARLLADQVEREHLATEERERVAAAALLARATTLAIASSEHKLKVPLSVIKGAARRLLAPGDLDDDERRSLVEAVDRQAGVLEACVLDLLRHHEPSSPAPPLALDTVQLEPLLLRAVSDVRLVAGPRTVTLACADRLECTADAAALVHVLEHLLDNAVKYTPAGTPIDITAERDRDEIRIVVADQGPGLGGDDLFAGFARGDDDGDVPGSGLGLYVVRSLVESMGGTVTADDHPSGGARFSVRLPVAERSAR